MSPYTSVRNVRKWKGKERALGPRQDYSAPGEGPGANDGIVLPLTLVGNSAYDAIYTIPILVGSNKQNLSLQVDTGSSDLWIASTSCSSSSCGQARGSLYDSSHSKPTGRDFTITYVEGEVSGPIVWDTVQLGDYVIDNQALAAASSVNDEPLSSSFSGILGLALPLNSYISQQLPPGNSDAPDGAILSSNLFTMSPSSTAPAARFISLSLERPGSSKIPSLLGIGRHPSSIVTDPSQIEYAPLVTDYTGAYFWKANVNAVTVYVDGVPKPVSLNSGTVGGSFGNRGSLATAVVDSGMPIILASQDVANGIYGALGIGPASDGQYYIDCTTPLNMTITLDGRPEIPLHPLDLTETTSTSSSTCIGIIQAYPAGSSIESIADIVLGVPFMRSTYTVMAYDQPDSSGNFPNMTSPMSSSGSMSSSSIRPRLGLMSLTDPTEALDEFNTVRVLKQPLGTSGGANGGAQGKVSGEDSDDGKKLSVGVEVLIGLIGFFALCFMLFGARWLYVRRKYKRDRSLTVDDSIGDIKDPDILLQDVAYRLARRSSRSDPYGPSEDSLRAMRYSEYKRGQELGVSEYTDDTERTRVAIPGSKNDAGEFGSKRGSDGAVSSLHHDSGSDSSEEEDVGDARMGYRAVKTHARSDSDESITVPPRSHTTNSIPGEYLRRPDTLHQRMSSDAPLLPHARSESYVSTMSYPPVNPIAPHSNDQRASSRGNRSSRIPPPLPLDLPTAEDDPYSLNPGTSAPSTPPRPPEREVNLLGSPLPTSTFDLSSMDEVIRSAQTTDGHGHGQPP